MILFPNLVVVVVIAIIPRTRNSFPRQQHQIAEQKDIQLIVELLLRGERRAHVHRTLFQEAPPGNSQIVEPAKAVLDAEYFFRVLAQLLLRLYLFVDGVYGVAYGEEVLVVHMFKGSVVFEFLYLDLDMDMDMREVTVN